MVWPPRESDTGLEFSHNPVRAPTADGATNKQPSLATNDIYPLEEIQIKYTDMRVKAGYSGRLKYDLKGVFTKLNGAEEVDMMIPASSNN